MKLYFDGSCGPTNPGGVVGYGWVLNGSSTTREGYGILFKGGPSATNNVAEYGSLAAALVNLLPRSSTIKRSDRVLTIVGDSRLTIEQLRGEWRVRGENIKPIASVVNLMVKELEDRGWTIKMRHVRRELNERAGKLSRRGLNEQLADRRPLTQREARNGN